MKLGMPLLLTALATLLALSSCNGPTVRLPVREDERSKPDAGTEDDGSTDGDDDDDNDDNDDNDESNED